MKMASVRKHGKKWQAGVRLKGTRKRKLFKTRMQAQRWALEQEEWTCPKSAGAIHWLALSDSFVTNHRGFKKRLLSGSGGQ
ncbi:hypothetical protein [Emcibacter sp.]|uniref:hypothetical protein n=1 Tax=Emcibacter sp. TaxID=1979954 RepID=UPI002AA9362B|nr:hypothetical protein [Emcibacter sp.]